jgi:hypothetical protein
MYIKLFRRKWKEKGGKESYSNEYEIHKKGFSSKRIL